MSSAWAQASRPSIFATRRRPRASPSSSPSARRRSPRASGSSAPDGIRTTGRTKAWPTREILDRAAPNHPVLLGRIDGHASWANSRALQAAGIDATTPDPSGGRLIRDATNIPTGMLVDTAQALVERHVTEPGAAELEARVLAADRAMSSVGLTMVHDAGTSSRHDCHLSATGRRAARLNTRLYVMIDSSPATTNEWFTRGPLIDRDHRVTVRAVKMFADGALGSRGAALLEPYEDEPGNRGLLVTPPERLAAIAREAARRGLSAGDPCDRRRRQPTRARHLRDDRDARCLPLARCDRESSTPRSSTRSTSRASRRLA